MSGMKNRSKNQTLANKAGLELQRMKSLTMFDYQEMHFDIHIMEALAW